MNLLLDQGTERGYLPEPDKSIFICDPPPAQEGAAQREFEAERLTKNVVMRIIYLGTYVGPQEEREDWFRTQADQWSVGVWNLTKVATRHP